MIFPTPRGIELVGVADPGKPNLERIVLRVTEEVNLARFGVLAGLAQSDGSAVPMIDHIFWLGASQVSAPHLIFVFTGSGQRSQNSPSGNPVLTYFWGRPTTVFNSTNIVPILFQFAALAIGTNAEAPKPGHIPAPRPPLAPDYSGTDYSGTPLPLSFMEFMKQSAQAKEREHALSREALLALLALAGEKQPTQTKETSDSSNEALLALLGLAGEKQTEKK